MKQQNWVRGNAKLPKSDLYVKWYYVKWCHVAKGGGWERGIEMLKKMEMQTTAIAPLRLYSSLLPDLPIWSL